MRKPVFQLWWAAFVTEFWVVHAERDWSQANLAAKMKVSRQTINAIETGKYNPSLPLAFQIARLFHQPIEAVFEPDLDELAPEPLPHWPGLAHN